MWSSDVQAMLLKYPVMTVVEQGDWVAPKVVPKRESSCGRYALVKTSTGDFWPCLCRGRACRRNICRELYSERVVKIIAGIERLNGFTNMVTLTLSQVRYPDPSDAWSKMTHLFHNLLRELQRIWGKIPYVWCLEKHPSNMYPHLHFATSRFIPVNWDWCRDEPVPETGMYERPLSELWDQVGAGICVDARMVRGGVAKYMGKGFTREAVEAGVSSYVTKDFLSIGDYVKPGSRIWGCSRGLKRLPVNPSPDVEFVNHVEMFDKEGSFSLPVEETQRIIEWRCGVGGSIIFGGSSSGSTKSKRQERKDLARPCRIRSTKSVKVVASGEGEQERQASYIKACIAAISDQCENQESEEQIKTDRQMAFWE